METLLKKMNEVKDGIVFAEVPLLFEGNYENLFDKILFIVRDLPLRIEGVIRRDNLSELEIKKRIQSQFDPTTYEGGKRLNKNNVIIIENNGSIDELKNKILSFLNQS